MSGREQDAADGKVLPPLLSQGRAEAAFSTDKTRIDQVETVAVAENMEVHQEGTNLQQVLADGDAHHFPFPAAFHFGSHSGSGVRAAFRYSPILVVMSGCCVATSVSSATSFRWS